MWLKPSPGPDTTKLSSGEGQEILVDGVSREEVCSKREEKMPFHHMTTVLPFLLSFEAPFRGSFGVRGAAPRSDPAANASELARARHNPRKNGYRPHVSSRIVSTGFRLPCTGGFEMTGGGSFLETLLDPLSNLWNPVAARRLWEGHLRGDSNAEPSFGLLMFELSRRAYRIAVP